MKHAVLFREISTNPGTPSFLLFKFFLDNCDGLSLYILAWKEQSRPQEGKQEAANQEVDKQDKRKVGAVDGIAHARRDEISDALKCFRSRRKSGQSNRNKNLSEPVGDLL